MSQPCAAKLRRTSRRMNWKTCSVEAGGGIGKRCSSGLPTGFRPLRRSCSRPTVSGMQKHGLTMFAAACYSSLVPRVHPGLLCAVSFLRDCVCRGSQWSYRRREIRFRMKFVASETFLAETFLRCLPPFCGRICRARLTKRSAPGVWPGATVGSAKRSSKGIQNLSSAAS